MQLATAVPEFAAGARNMRPYLLVNSRYLCPYLRCTFEVLLHSCFVNLISNLPILPFSAFLEALHREWFSVHGPLLYVR